MTIGALAAKLEAAIIREGRDIMRYEVELDGKPLAAIVQDDEQGILRCYTTTYDKLKHSDNGQHGDPAREGKQNVLF